MKKIKMFIATLFLVFASLILVSCQSEYKIKITCDNSQGNVEIVEEVKDGSYKDNEKITINVIAKNGYTLEYFMVNDEKIMETSTYSTSIKSDLNVQVFFVKNTYGINLSYDDTLGSVALEPSTNSYNHGEKVKVVVTPNEYVIVKSFKVNGEEKTLTNNEYELEVLENSEVEVLFEKVAPKEMPLATLEAIQGNVKFDGVSFYDGTGEENDTANSVVTIFGTDVIHQLESDLITGTIYYNNLYVNNNGILAEAVRTIENKVELYDSTDQFADFYNQFSTFNVKDFEYVEDYVFAIKDLDKAKKAATAITGWVESIDTFLLYLDEELNVKSIKIVTKSIKIDDDFSYVSTYEFDVEEHGTAYVDESLLKPYERSEEHNQLADALEKAENAKNYTIKHFDHEEGYEDIDYNVYVTEKAIYSDCVGWESGYVLMDNYIHPFEYNPEIGKVTLTDPVSDSGLLSDFQAIFTKINVELFAYVGEGKFVLRDEQFASTLTQYFAEGTDEMQQYAYALNLSITIKDDTLYQVQFVYSTWGITAEVTLTYSNFDETEMPINFDNVDRISVLDNFIGSYRDNSGNFAVITESGVTLNGKVFTVTGYDEVNNMLIGIYNNQNYYINKLSQTQLYVSNEDFTIAYILNSIETSVVTIPLNYKGIWENEEHSLEVQTHVVRLDGVELELLSFDENDGIIALLEEITYAFSAQNAEMTVIAIEKDTIKENYVLTKTSKEIGVEIPESYVGVYKTKEAPLFEIVITYSSIIINGEKYEMTNFNETDGILGVYLDDANCKVQLSSTSTDELLFTTSSTTYTLNRVLSISGEYIGTWASVVEGSNYLVEVTEASISINGEVIDVVYNIEYGYMGTYNNETVYLKHTISSIDGSDCLVLYSDTFSSFLVKKVETSDEIPSKYIGVYSGVKEETSYVIEITSSQVLIKIGEGDVIEAKNISYDATEGYFSFTLDDVEYNIMDSSYTDPITEIMFMTPDYSFYVICTKA